MDIESKTAIKILEAMANCNSLLVYLTQSIRQRKEVVEAHHRFECWKYETGSLIEGYVDVELQNGKAIAWCIEIEWSNESWLIRSRVAVNDEQGQDTLIEFPNKITNILDECIENLLQATSDLTNSLDLIDLSLAQLK